MPTFVAVMPRSYWPPYVRVEEPLLTYRWPRCLTLKIKPTKSLWTLASTFPAIRSRIFRWSFAPKVLRARISGSFDKIVTSVLIGALSCHWLWLAHRGVQALDLRRPSRCFSPAYIRVSFSRICSSLHGWCNISNHLACTLFHLPVN